MKSLVSSLITIGVIGSFIIGAFIGYPHYLIYQQSLAGLSELERAKYSKMILIEQARSEAESAKLKATAEISRAQGVAEANRIVAEGLGGPEGYLRYLYIQSLTEGSGANGQRQIIYVPTEAGLPILEAGRAVAGDK